MKKHFLKLVVFTVCFASVNVVAQIPDRKGWWKFDEPSNLTKAETGTAVDVIGEGSSVDGPSATNKAIQLALGSYLDMNHGILPNGGTLVNEYTLQIDFSIPEVGIWHAFFQTDPTNGSDAELFANTSNSIGVAAVGYSAKAIVADKWYRMLVSVKNGEFFRIYIDGVLWQDGTAGAIDSRFGLAASVIIFGDNDGDDGTINCSELGIWDMALDAGQALELGGANNARVPVRTKLGSWKFDDPASLLKAEIGNPLELTGTQVSVAGPTADNNATKLEVGSHLKMTDGILPNGGGVLVNEYSMQFDIYIPELGVTHAIFQTDAANTTDADLFVNKTGNIGTAATGYSANALSAKTWYRMVVTVKNGGFFKIYINGELWLNAAGQAVDGRWALAEKLLLFADENGEDGAILCSEINIWEVALTEAEIAEIGGDPSGQIPDRMGWWKFENPIYLGKADIGNDLVENGASVSVSGPVIGNNAIEVGPGSYLIMNHGIYGNGEGFMVNDYTLQIDFMIPEGGIWHAFFQTSTGNTGDADLFINKTNNIGTSATSYTTNAIVPNTWYRMLVVVKNGSYFRVYMNGEIWLDATGQAVDGRWALADKLLLFADDDGEDGLIDCSEVAIWDVPLNEDQVKKLGDATKVVTGLVANKSTESGLNLGQNFPNPFTTLTTFPYQIQKSGNVSFRILDVAGNEVRNIDAGLKSAGKYSLEINSENMKPGIYFLQMKSNQGLVTRKMILMQ